jgi:hypothetical protein
MLITNVPPDILKEIFKYLDGNSLLALGMTTKQFFNKTNDTVRFLIRVLLILLGNMG